MLVVEEPLYQQAEDDEIYRLYQICIAPFSNSRSIRSLPTKSNKRSCKPDMTLFIRFVHEHVQKKERRKEGNKAYLSYWVSIYIKRNVAHGSTCILWMVEFA